MGADAKQERVLRGTAQEGQGKARKSQGARAGRERTGRFGSIKLSHAICCAHCQILIFEKFKCSVRNVSV